MYSNQFLLLWHSLYQENDMRTRDWCRSVSSSVSMLLCRTNMKSMQVKEIEVLYIKQLNKSLHTSCPSIQNTSIYSLFFVHLLLMLQFLGTSCRINASQGDLSTGVYEAIYTLGFPTFWPVSLVCYLCITELCAMISSYIYIQASKGLLICAQILQIPPEMMGITHTNTPRAPNTIL